jgi:hypothetical protein
MTPDRGFSCEGRLRRVVVVVVAGVGLARLSVDNNDTVVLLANPRNGSEVHS